MLNRAVLTGRLTRDVEVRQTQSGLSVASFTLAVDAGKDKPADFINCVVWRQGADFLGQYSHKGDMIGVDGRIATRSYDKNGQNEYVTEVVADKVEILAHKGDKQQAGNSPAPQQNRSQTDWNRSQTYNQQSYPEEDYSGGIVINSDDLPF